MDQRIQKTFDALQAAMRELLGKNTWDEISVQALCETAGVSRTTFYAHFTHKDDLLHSLLISFEKAMLVDNNARSLLTTKKFRFLPMLLNHVNGNRQLFSQTNNSIEGYPVAFEFRKLISRLVNAEADEATVEFELNESTRQFIAGGIYSALVLWSSSSQDITHLSLLSNIDNNIGKILKSLENTH